MWILRIKLTCGTSASAQALALPSAETAVCTTTPASRTLCLDAPTLVPGITTAIPESPLAHCQHQSFPQGRVDLLPIILSTTFFFLGSPLLFSSSLAFSSQPQAFLCGHGCFHHCRKYPLSPGGFCELSFCFDPLIVFGGTARDHGRNVKTMGVGRRAGPQKP